MFMMTSAGAVWLPANNPTKKFHTIAAKFFFSSEKLLSPCLRANLCCVWRENNHYHAFKDVYSRHIFRRLPQRTLMVSSSMWCFIDQGCTERIRDPCFCLWPCASFISKSFFLFCFCFFCLISVPVTYPGLSRWSTVCPLITWCFLTALSHPSRIASLRSVLFSMCPKLVWTPHHLARALVILRSGFST